MLLHDSFLLFKLRSCRLRVSVCNPQPGAAQTWLWSVQASSPALAWTPQWWSAALPSGGSIRYCFLNFNLHILHNHALLSCLKVGILFRFTQQMAGLVTDYMAAYGTKFAWKCVPKSVDKLSSGALQVTWSDTHTGNEHKATYDSVLWAVGESVHVAVCGSYGVVETSLNTWDHVEWNI